MNPRALPLLCALTLTFLPVALLAQNDDRAARQSKRVFERADRNGDGKLGPEEYPAGLRRQFLPPRQIPPPDKRDRLPCNRVASAVLVDADSDQRVS